MDYNALSRVIAVANSKGGAGKTSTAANLAGLAAAAGWRVLLIDLDPQGNAGHDLGYTWKDQSDFGRHLVDALIADKPLQPTLLQVRPNLDAISGGAALDELEDVLAGRARRGSDPRALLARNLAPLAGDYDLVVIDTPPTRPTLLQLALSASRWIVVPTRPDRSSIEGLRGLEAEIAAARSLNPQLEILGAVLFDVSTSATVVRRNAVQDINDALDGAAPLFDSVVRHSNAAAVEAREKGLLVHELAESIDNAEPYWKALQEGRTPTRVAGSAPALAEDYVLLSQEILTSIARHEEQEEGVPA